MKTQVIVIHGGTTFDTYEEYMVFLKSCDLTLEKINKKDWKDGLAGSLGSDFEVIYPKMPNSKNARYEEWQIWFEKLFPLLKDEVILVGHSLGGIFLAKYLSENSFPKPIKSLHLVAPPYDTEYCKESLADFALAVGFEKLTAQAPKVFIYQSKDDASVPYQDAEKYHRQLPGGVLRTFEDRGHFNQEEFPEIIQDIKANN